MLKMKTSELTGAALDWAVAKCESAAWDAYDAALHADKPTGSRPSEYLRDYEFSPEEFKPSTDWAQGGPIIERERIVTQDFDGELWIAALGDPFNKRPSRHGAAGRTPLIAAMRCYVASKLGDTVDIPDELKENASC